MESVIQGAVAIELTHFLPAERVPQSEVLRQSQRVGDLGGGRLAVELLPFAVVVLNRQRQIVFANQALVDLFGFGDPDEVLGKRIGDVLECRRACETPGGCGTTEACTTCGAALATQAAQRGKAARQECRIASTIPGGDRDLRVWARPFSLAGEDYSLFTMLDISHERRREALERIFFHDVLNTAGGLQGVVSLFADASPEEREEFVAVLVRLTGTLVDEIKAQRDLVAMEKGELCVEPRPLTSGTVVRSVVAAYREHEVALRRALRIDDEVEDVPFVGDPVLLGRVLGNMVKNALEASPVGGIVAVGCRATGGTICFTVHNASVMPRAVQLQVFARSFTTKGTGRGLGTYSMRLLSERYLGGRVWFSSAEGEGTTFYAQYPINAPAVH